jgi:hypothetical protein
MKRPPLKVLRGGKGPSIIDRVKRATGYAGKEEQVGCSDEECECADHQQVDQPVAAWWIQGIGWVVSTAILSSAYTTIAWLGWNYALVVAIPIIQPLTWFQILGLIYLSRMLYRT